VATISDLCQGITMAALRASPNCVPAEAISLNISLDFGKTVVGPEVLPYSEGGGLRNTLRMAA